MKKTASLEPVAAGNRDAMIDQARVQVVVSFPAVWMSVADASALGTGQVIDLGVSLATARMTVQVTGEDIGESQLMVVGTHAGVMLTRMRS
jgi:flagellar motor switch/type III secretory pathway protein FliN